MKTKLSKRLAALGAGLFLGLCLLEAGARILHPRDGLRSSFVASDPVLHHRFVRGAHSRYKQPEFDTAYDIDSLGLREREIAVHKAPGTRRILVVGDSFTEGIGVEAAETYPSVIQRRLNQERLNARWEVINAGSGSYSPLLEYLFLKYHGLALDPDLVILSFDLSDVHDDIEYTTLARFDAKGDPIAVLPEPERADPPLVAAAKAAKDAVKRNLRFYSFLRQKTGSFFDGAELAQIKKGDIRVDKYAMLRESYPYTDDRDLALSYKYLRLIRDTLEARGIDFWIVVYPYGLQVGPEEWSKGRVLWGFERGVVYSTRTQEQVVEFGHRNDMRVIDLCPTFKDAAKTQFPIYLSYDGHWRALGHEIAASALYEPIISYARERDTEVSELRTGAAALGPPASP